MGQPNSHLLEVLEAYLRNESLEKKKEPLNPEIFTKENVVFPNKRTEVIMECLVVCLQSISVVIVFGNK